MFQINTKIKNDAPIVGWFDKKERCNCKIRCQKHAISCQQIDWTVITWKRRKLFSQTAFSVFFFFIFFACRPMTVCQKRSYFYHAWMGMVLMQLVQFYTWVIFGVAYLFSDQPDFFSILFCLHLVKSLYSFIWKYFDSTI